MDWQVSNEQHIDLISSYYDLYLTALDGVPSLVDRYGISYDRIIAISHHELDIRMLVEQKGIEVFDKLAAYGVVSEYVYAASAMRGIPRMPKVASLGIDYQSFFAPLPDRLATVGYGSSMSVKTYGVEWKRGELAEAAAREAGLAFKIAGSTGNQTSFHDMPQFYRTIDALLTSSVSEAAQLPVMEAAAAGRLVIGTPVGHFPLRAYQGGGILAPIEADKFKAFAAKTLSHYRDNPSEFAEKCASIQEAARTFDWTFAINDWVELIESAGQSARIHRGTQPATTPATARIIRKAVVCDVEWLSSYLTNEHYYLIKLLGEEHGFDVLDSSKMNFEEERTISLLNSYGALLIAYQRGARIPIDRLTPYKIFRIDELVSYSDVHDKLVSSYISGCDTIITPYSYDFDKYYTHRDVVLIPYSSSLEGCLGYDDIKFNADPLVKVLVSGSVAWDRPFRQYTAGLSNETIAVLDHPGYGNRYTDDSTAIVRTAYFRELSKYISCFCDGHTANGDVIRKCVLLKNFEIASVGSLLLADRVIEKELNDLGFVDYKNCIFCGRDDFLEKTKWITSEDNRREVDRIRRAGMDLARGKHLTRHRAEQIAELVTNRLQGRSVNRTKGLTEFNDSKPTVRSFDLFDTLVARRCVEPREVFRIVEMRAKRIGFAEARMRAEAEICGSTYTLQDIYDQLSTSHGVAKDSAELLMNVELAVEEEMLFPIAETCSSFAQGDVIVSDMYLPEDFLMRIISQQCRLNPSKLFLSSHGKRSGDIWATINEEVHLAEHIGDNEVSDVASAQASGIAARLFTGAKQTPAESDLSDSGYGWLANLVREARLRSWNPDGELRLLQLYQIDLNFPVILLATLSLLHLSRERGWRRILFSGRDCYLWHQLYQELLPELSNPPSSAYFYTSRIARVSPSRSYLKYFREACGGDPAVVADVCGTGWSLDRLLDHTGFLTVDSFLIHHIDTASWREEYESFAPVRRRSNVMSLVRRAVHSDEAEVMEELNRAPHPQVEDVTEIDGRFEPVFTASDREGGVARDDVLAVHHGAFRSAVALLKGAGVGEMHVGDHRLMVERIYRRFEGQLASVGHFLAQKRQEQARFWNVVKHVN
ncbi:hypothetical protein CK230_23695 [Mesorhizobium sp. WSM3859]|nr:hypothetical protein CK230_23695 [Mesorhizobium sp. WSM3859]